MSRKNSDYIQNELFPLADVEKVQHYPRKKWYYVTDARNQMMIVGISPDGDFMWSEHDTRGVGGLYPHVWNTRKEAERACGIPKSGRRIHEWWYSRSPRG